MYGARLAEALCKEAASRGEDMIVRGMGGVNMRAAGVDLRVDSTELGVIGVIEVLKHLPVFIQIFFQLRRDMVAARPDAVVVIDYPTFNLMMAKFLKKNGIPVIWYVSPQVWVWHKSRIYTLAKVCSKMMVIFPFEVEIYTRNTSLATEFVGHPLLDIVEERRDPAIQRDDRLIVLLPGSRTMEVTRLFEPMLETALQFYRKHPEFRFVTAVPREKIYRLACEIFRKFQEKHPGEELPLKIVCGETAKYQQQATAGIAASGTVTVESAIAGLPLVVVYKLNYLTILMMAVVVKLFRGFFTMANIIANREVYQEYLQTKVCPEELVPALERIIPGGVRRPYVEEGMQIVRDELKSQDKSAGERAAEAVFSVMEPRTLS